MKLSQQEEMHRNKEDALPLLVLWSRYGLRVSPWLLNLETELSILSRDKKYLGE
jgi:hypothetical protein